MSLSIDPQITLGNHDYKKDKNFLNKIHEEWKKKTIEQKPNYYVPLELI